jgi:hypothetical protein
VRTLVPPAIAVLGNRLGLTQLIQMDTTDTLYITTAAMDIMWLGNTFIGGKAIGATSIKDQGGTVVGLQFSLSGVQNDTLAIALAEPIQGKRVQVWTAILDPDTQTILDASLTWAGTLDQMPIQQAGGNAIVNVTAEHRGIAFARAKGKAYTDGDQQAMFPGDKCLQFIVAQSQHQDVWPAASFFHQ